MRNLELKKEAEQVAAKLDGQVFVVIRSASDGGALRNVTTSTNDAAIALSVISLAHNLNMRVIAEGVETREQVAFLTEHGCDEMQGYFFSRPLTAAAFTTLLKDGRNLHAT